MLVLAATVKVKESGIDVMVAAVLKVIPQVRAESGNLFYYVSQEVDDPSVFQFYENWNDQSSLDLHDATPHIGEFQLVIKDLIVTAGQAKSRLIGD